MKTYGTNRHQLRALLPDVTTSYERQVSNRPHYVHKAGKFTVNPGRAETKYPPRRKPTCYNCGKYGHLRRECKSKPLERNNPNSKNM